MAEYPDVQLALFADRRLVFSLLSRIAAPTYNSALFEASAETGQTDAVVTRLIKACGKTTVRLTSGRRSLWRH